MRFVRTTSALLLSASLAAAAPGASARNYLLFLADDLGRDKIRAYEADFPGYAAAAQWLPQTNTIDSLASQGLRFTRAWANPICSPTRASLQTGVHPYRHGVIIPLGERAAGLDLNVLSAPTLAESFSSRGYATGYFGKWHIGTEDETGATGTPATAFTDEPHPSRLGWDRFYGTLGGVIGNYTDWTRVGWLSRGDGFVATETEHATTRTAEVALSWINSRAAGTPWLAIVAFHAPHSRGTGNSWNETDVDLAKIRSASLSCLDPDLDPATPPTCSDVSLAGYQALVEHMDIEIENILLGMDPAVLDDTIIIFAGDNGTPHEAAEWNFEDPDRGKGTAYETGVGVPLIIADGATWRTGAAGAITAPNRRVLAAVTLTDIYQTLHNLEFSLSVAGDVAQDSISFVDCFTEDDEFCNFPGTRFGYAEWNGWGAVHFGYEKLVAEYLPPPDDCMDASFFQTDEEPLELEAGKVDEQRLQDYFTDLHDAVPTSWANGIGFCS
jgi:arylsulfatase A-like enzyme